MPPIINQIETNIIHVSDKTDWTLIVVRTDEGLIGLGEATLYGQESRIAAIVGDLSQSLIGQEVSAIDHLIDKTSDVEDRAERAVVSALEQASWDLKGKREGKPVYELLGGGRTDLIQLYANINRRTKDRSPASFGVSAKDALAAGHSMIKIAPFDGLSADMGVEGDKLFDAGMGRISATCEAVGPDCPVLVDCHWRLSQERARTLIKHAAEIGLYWVECPLPEDPDDCSALASLRPLKDSLGVRLAGAEQGTTFSYFEKFILAGVYDVIMPDVKYSGGIGEMRRLAELADNHGIGFSPHNPSGPLCHIASLHVAATIPNLLVLEHQFDESPMFMDLCPGAVPKIENGCSSLPSGPGLGFNL